MVATTRYEFRIAIGTGAEHKGYLHVGRYPDGRVGEMFVAGDKWGGALGGPVSSYVAQRSIKLRYGVPVAVIADKFSFVEFEPKGLTGDPDGPFAKSIIDYIVRRLAAAEDRRDGLPALAGGRTSRGRS